MPNTDSPGEQKEKQAVSSPPHKFGFFDAKNQIFY